jgi:hypothetical protein
MAVCRCDDDGLAFVLQMRLLDIPIFSGDILVRLFTFLDQMRDAAGCFLGRGLFYKRY